MEGVLGERHVQKMECVRPRFGRGLTVGRVSLGFRLYSGFGLGRA